MTFTNNTDTPPAIKLEEDDSSSSKHRLNSEEISLSKRVKAEKTSSTSPSRRVKFEKESSTSPSRRSSRSRSSPKDAPTVKKEVSENSEDNAASESDNTKAASPSWPGWATVESEPAIFNELLKEIGVCGAQVEEIYALDEDSLRAMSPAHGMIFLFRWKPEGTDNVETTCPEGVWFANQVIDNACASIALLNIVFNSEVELSDELRSFKEFTETLTPPLKGLAVANCEHIRNIHNSFARESEMVDVDINLADIAKRRAKAATSGADDEDTEDEVFHFIAYVHVGDTLYELDGLKRQPVKLLTCPKDEWLVHVGPSVLERISRYNEGELLFNLLAIVPERSSPDQSFGEIAKKRKVDYEGFVQRALGALGRQGLARALIADEL